MTLPQNRMSSVIPLFGQSTDHSSVGQDLHGWRAQRPSRAAARPARQRFTLDYCEHDGSLAISWDDTVHRGDLGGIDTVERRGTRRAGVVGHTSPERFIRPSLRGIRYRSVKKRFSVPEHWIRAVLHVESSAKQGARSSKGAIGLMQIMPKTWTELRARYGLGADPFDPHDNILAGAAYICELCDRYGAPGFLAAYNAGPGRYERHLATGRPPPDETQAYVATLAPMINRVRTDAQLGDVTRSLAWTSSPVFATRTAGSSSDRSSPTDMRRNRSSRAHGVVDLSALVPHSGNLFVHRTGEMRSR
jgi:hypothetical protein